jgi:hypothetical protein
MNQIKISTKGLGFHNQSISTSISAILQGKVHVQHGSYKNFNNLGFRFSQSWSISTSINANHLMFKRR